MFFHEWQVLLVDDEPDVLSLSKLVMQDFEVYGIPLEINTAKSKAEALEFLNGRPDRFAPVPRLAVAFIDVVMENDSAGLELCQAIREDMGNKVTQLFIRTGQPGVAPERAVIDRYDINGYFTKAEATEDKLYSLVKSGVRQYYSYALSYGTTNLLSNLLVASGSPAELIGQFQNIVKSFVAGVGSEPTLCYMVGEMIVARYGWDEETARNLIKKLDAQEGTPLNDLGDKYIIDDDDHLLIKVGAQPPRPPVYVLLETTFKPPADAVRNIHQIFATLVTLMQKAM